MLPVRAQHGQLPRKPSQRKDEPPQSAIRRANLRACIVTHAALACAHRAPHLASGPRWRPGATCRRGASSTRENRCGATPEAPHVGRRASRARQPIATTDCHTSAPPATARVCGGVARHKTGSFEGEPGMTRHSMRAPAPIAFTGTGSTTRRSRSGMVCTLSTLSIAHLPSRGSSRSARRHPKTRVRVSPPSNAAAAPRLAHASPARGTLPSAREQALCGGKLACSNVTP